MRIAIDCRSIHLHMGGIGRAALDLAMELDSSGQGHDFSFLISANALPGLRFSSTEAVICEAGMIDEQFEQVGLPTILEDLNTDVYVNLAFSIPTIKTSRFQVAYIHDVVFEDRPELVEPGLRSYLQKWSRFAAKHADHIITVSDHARHRICKVYGVPKLKVTRIYNGIAASAFKRHSSDSIREVKTRLSVSDDYVLYLGSIEEKKGVRELLEAFASIVEQNPDHHLVLAGAQGGFERLLHEIITHSRLENRVRFTGYVSESDKQALLADASAFVYPSLYEGFGLPPLEAMALGVPTVASNATCIPEVVGDSCLTVDVKDRAAFAKALQTALTDPDYRREAKIAGSKQARRYSWHKAAEQLIGVCESLGKR